MGKYILMGAVVGSLLSLVVNISAITGLLWGAIAGVITFTLIKRNSAHTEGPEDEEEKHTLKLREEQIDIKKERIQTGEVNIHKEVVEEKKTFTVPIRREEMVIEAGSEEEFRIPLKEEEIEISKHPVQLNDVSITKRQIEEIQEVKETLKKETAVVESKGKVDIKEEN